MSTLLVFHPEAISSPMLALRFLQDQTIQKLIDFPLLILSIILIFYDNDGCCLNEKKGDHFVFNEENMFHPFSFLQLEHLASWKLNFIPH